MNMYRCVASVHYIYFKPLYLRLKICQLKSMLYLRGNGLPIKFDQYEQEMINVGSQVLSTFTSSLFEIY